MRYSARWLVLVGIMIGVAACGTGSAPPQNAGKAGSASLSLTTVPTIRSVTVSPAKASFGNCSGGLASQNTRSTSGKLGFPDGRCLVGLLNPGVFPIKITNTGIASFIYVSGSSASPADGGIPWSLCTTGGHHAAICNGKSNNLPGTDQYLVRNFSNFGKLTDGITSTPVCDHEFDASGRCWAVEGASQTEGIELTGPEFSSDDSTNWTLTITWTPVPSQG